MKMLISFALLFGFPDGTADLGKCAKVTLAMFRQE
jgi:hypothetical protein